MPGSASGSVAPTALRRSGLILVLASLAIAGAVLVTTDPSGQDADSEWLDGPCLSADATPHTSPQIPELTTTEQVSTENLRAWIDWLTDPRHQGRRSGTGTTPQIAEVLGRYLVASPPSGLGLAAHTADGPCQAFAVLDHREVNVVAHLRSRSPASTTILLGAHYDGQGRHPTRGPLPGADDNASGVAAVLEAARLLSRNPPADTEVVIVLFAAEEVGLAGSSHWLGALGDHPAPDLALILDMVGRPLPIDDGLGFALRAHGASDRLPKLAERASETTATPIVPIERLGLRAPGDSDDTPFAEAGIDVALLTSGLHADYHDLGDTADAVDLDQIERAARWLVTLVDTVDASARDGG